MNPFVTSHNRQAFSHFHKSRAQHVEMLLGKTNAITLKCHHFTQLHHSRNVHSPFVSCRNIRGSRDLGEKMPAFIEPLAAGYAIKASAFSGWNHLQGHRLPVSLAAQFSRKFSDMGCVGKTNKKTLPIPRNPAKWHSLQQERHCVILDSSSAALETPGIFTRWCKILPKSFQRRKSHKFFTPAVVAGHRKQISKIRVPSHQVH